MEGDTAQSAAGDNVTVGIESEHGIHVGGRHHHIRVAIGPDISSELGDEISTPTLGTDLEVPELPRCH